MAEFRDRKRRAQALMAQAGLDALFVNTEPSVFYFSGVKTSRPPGVVVAATGDATLIIGEREASVPAVMEGAAVDAVIPWQAANGSVEEAIGQALKSMGIRNGKVGFEDDKVTVAAFQRLDRAIEADLVAASSLVAQLRWIKSSSEIDYIRSASAVTDKAMQAAIDTLQDGGRECDAAGAADLVMRQHAMAESYETLIGTGQRSAMLRRFPSTLKPEEGQVIRLDLAAKHAFASGYAYHSDQTRSVVLGDTPPELQEQLDLTLAVHRKTLDGIRPGRTIADVSRDALDLAKGTKFESHISMGGHGIGLDVHEPPGFSERTDIEIEVGMCFAVEPSIVVPGKSGTCVEDTVVVTADGHARLTNLEQKFW